MVENTLKLTEDEAELYDRQIRLWGIEAQQRLRNARVLVIGMDGLGAEIVKNSVLSGIKSLLMLDDRNATKGDTRNQFFIPEDNIGQNRAESSHKRVQALNPLVAVSVDSQPITEKQDTFFSQFDFVVCCGQDPIENIRINKICHKLGIGFFASAIFGTFGYVFEDLQEHEFTLETTAVRKSGDIKVTKVEKLVFPTLEDSLNVDLNDVGVIKNFKKLPPSFFVLKVLIKFWTEHKRYPTSSEEDLAVLVKFRDSILDGVDYPIENFPDVLFRCLTTAQPSPCCAIVGAVVAQEIVKAVSRKDTPHCNFFFFDPLSLSGYVQSIIPAKAQPMEE